MGNPGVRWIFLALYFPSTLTQLLDLLLHTGKYFSYQNVVPHGNLTVQLIRKRTRLLAAGDSFAQKGAIKF